MTDELRTGLADIDRKLRALQDELAAVDVERAGAAPTPAPPEPPASAPVEPPRPAPERAWPAAESARAAEDLALAIIARAEEQARGIVDEAHERVVALNGQAEQLMALRDGLRRSARELLDAYAGALEQIEHAAAAPAPAVAEAAPQRAEEAPAGTSGAVTITAEPFQHVAELATFTEGLEHVPGAGAVTVQNFDGRRAEVGVTLSESVDLVRELHRVLPFAVEVTEESEGLLGLRVEPG